MKLNLKELGQQAVETSAKETKMRLSENASSMVFQLFTKNVYSNPIGTVVREITSNCFDSHSEAGVNLPVVIRKHFDKQTDTTYIDFIDRGVGMSPDRVINTYAVYFESTKRADNKQIGGFGIGAKSVLAYKRSTGQGEGEYDNTFYVITNHNGMQYTYCIYEGSETPIISELHSEPTDECNGTTVRIPVLKKDLEKFEAEMTRQLYYFENVIFEGFYETDWNDRVIIDEETKKPIPSLDNDYTIVRGKTFLYRGTDYDNKMHVCLGRVAYPIDFNALGLSASDYQLPVAVKLKVGDMGVTVSREQLDYNEEGIKNLKRILDEVKLEILELISQQYGEIKTLEQYFNASVDFGKLNFTDDISLYVGNLIKQKDVDFSSFKYSFMNMPNDKELMKFFFETKTFGTKVNRGYYSRRRSEFKGGYNAIKEYDNLLYHEDDFKRKIIKQAYLNSKYDNYYILKKRNLVSGFIREEIANVFNENVDTVRVTDDNDVVTVHPYILKLQEMQDELFAIIKKHNVDYDEFEVPQDFIDERKRKRALSPELRKTTIPVKFVGGYSKDRVKLSVLFDYDMPIFYGNTEEYHLLSRASSLFSKLFDDTAIVTHYSDYSNVLVTDASNSNRSSKPHKKSIAFIQIAKGNVKYMEHCKNAKPVRHFFKTMLMRKENLILEYFNIYPLIKKFNNLGDFYRDGYIDKINDDVTNKVNAVRSYFKTIPSHFLSSGLNDYSYVLQDYFDIKHNDITDNASKEAILIKTQIDELFAIEEKNEGTLSCFNLPYNAKSMSPKLVELLSVCFDS